MHLGMPQLLPHAKVDRSKCCRAKVQHQHLLGLRDRVRPALLKATNAGQYLLLVRLTFHRVDL